jgi:hypothetical protein
MQSIKVLSGHELADLADEELVFAIADINGIGITDALVPGVTLLVPEKKEAITKRIVVKPQPKTVTAIAGQTWIDIALQETGDEERLFELADLNLVGVTDDITPGSKLISANANGDKQGIVNVFIQRKPSSLHYSTGNPAPEGIEYWAIEYDFKVS